ncbi:hypothetical protein FGE12_12185 [Aggregicoccus sp. 17bor-14]|uniref:hypothetical protein n=1 Tax=Myxococcaceae TaxID=31 RepID=UPI00129CBA04|nr:MULTISPECIES: hypothetical protein [Myxococcaceae]MBF5043148.1 hypothetical protein [Simulacricoccus sp. 17bor-14]MRI88907.1 hypothetical protein [Aggregicoccus sp. 17bor-14]
MAHSLEGFIARAELLQTGAKGLTTAKVVPLAQGYALLPVTQALADEVNGGKERTAAFEQFWRLSERLAHLAESWSALGPVAYVETDYVRGSGVQASVVWDAGTRVLDPSRGAAGPVNWALQRIGVQCDEAQDAFDTLGLGRLRETEAWAQEGVGPLADADLQPGA